MIVKMFNESRKQEQVSSLTPCGESVTRSESESEVSSSEVVKYEVQKFQFQN